MARAPHGKAEFERASLFARDRQLIPVSDAPVDVPDRLYFRIGEVSTITGIPPYVLRYWESEFPNLQPKKSGGGQRLYRKRDVVMVLEIKKLLYQERYTVAGARKRLTEREERSRRVEARAALSRLRTGLEDLLKQLS